MSGNPNPTVCGNCGTENPPGEDVCQGCGEALTLGAEQSLGGVISDDPLLDTAPPVQADLGGAAADDPDSPTGRIPID